MRTNYLVMAAVIITAITWPASVAFAKVKVKKLLVTTQLDPWKEQKAVTKTFSAQGLFEIINGGAEEYIDRGLVGGIHQQFAGDGGKTVEVFVEDFSTPEKSAAMVHAKKESFTSVNPVTGLSDAESFSSKAIGATVFVASVGRFYVELTVSGFSEEKPAEQAAIAFINHYRKRSGG